MTVFSLAPSMDSLIGNFTWLLSKFGCGCISIWLFTDHAVAGVLHFLRVLLSWAAACPRHFGLHSMSVGCPEDPSYWRKPPAISEWSAIEAMVSASHKGGIERSPMLSGLSSPCLDRRPMTQGAVPPAPVTFGNSFWRGGVVPAIRRHFVRLTRGWESRVVSSQTFPSCWSWCLGAVLALFAARGLAKPFCWLFLSFCHRRLNT